VALPLAPLSRRRKVNILTVLGELVQTTAGKWITNPPTRCPTVTNSAPVRCSSVIRLASVAEADTPPGHACNAIARCSGRRVTLTAQPWMESGPKNWSTFLGESIIGREFSELGRDDWAVHVALWQAGELVAGTQTKASKPSTTVTDTIVSSGTRAAPVGRATVSTTPLLEHCRQPSGRDRTQPRVMDISGYP
jgi:hypothetical protein